MTRKLTFLDLEPLVNSNVEGELLDDFQINTKGVSIVTTFTH
jgi:hypothetical protein